MSTFQIFSKVSAVSTIALALLAGCSAGVDAGAEQQEEVGATSEALTGTWAQPANRCEYTAADLTKTVASASGEWPVAPGIYCTSPSRTVVDFLNPYSNRISTSVEWIGTYPTTPTDCANSFVEGEVVTYHGSTVSDWTARYWAKGDWYYDGTGCHFSKVTLPTTGHLATKTRVLARAVRYQGSVTTNESVRVGFMVVQ